METSAAMVQSAVEKAALTYAEWFANGDSSCHESKTRHAFIAPIIRALGWDTADRNVCYPEWRYKNKLRVDYALFPSVALPKTLRPAWRFPQSFLRSNRSTE